MRGATAAAALTAAWTRSFQSTRPMRGATITWMGQLIDFYISIHAPHAGRDNIYGHLSRSEQEFQSTRPMRGATFSIFFSFLMRADFNPRAPCGARPLWIGSAIRFLLFQSTRPMRGATAKVNKLLCTFLQKRHGFQIFLRKTLPFKAFCRLQIGKNFSICGANRCGNFCELLLRTIRSSVLPEGRSACSQNAQFYSHTFSRDNRNADCLFPDP